METTPYVINYKDGQAMLLELNDSQWMMLSEGFMHMTQRVPVHGIGLLDLQDVRSIIRQEPEQDNPSYSTEMTEEEKAYIAEQQKYESYLEEMGRAYEEDEADFDGSDI